MFQLNDWFINTRRRVLRKNGDKIKYRSSRRHKIKRLVEDGSNRSILQNNLPQAVEENVGRVQEVQLVNQREPMEHTPQTVEGKVIKQEQEEQPAHQMEPMDGETDERANNG